MPTHSVAGGRGAEGRAGELVMKMAPEANDRSAGAIGGGGEVAESTPLANRSTADGRGPNSFSRWSVFETSAVQFVRCAFFMQLPVQTIVNIYDRSCTRPSFLLLRICATVAATFCVGLAVASRWAHLSK